MLSNYINMLVEWPEFVFLKSYVHVPYSDSHLMISHAFYLIFFSVGVHEYSKNLDMRALV